MLKARGKRSAIKKDSTPTINVKNWASKKLKKEKVHGCWI